VCEKAGQEWIEDPTNRKQIFARNCIRQALEEPPFGRSNHLLVIQYQHRTFSTINATFVLILSLESQLELERDFHSLLYALS
jgi:tRNA(Ile)-lysidine synthase TilS/MesJ